MTDKYTGYYSGMNRLNDTMKHVTIFNYYDWHVKAYAVYLLRKRGVWLDWSEANDWFYSV